MSLFRSFSDKILYADNYIYLNENIKKLTSDKVFRSNYLDFLNRVFYVSFGELDSNASKNLDVFVKNIIN